jgi:hypothetical protein
MVSKMDDVCNYILKFLLETKTRFTILPRTIYALMRNGNVRTVHFIKEHLLGDIVSRGQYRNSIIKGNTDYFEENGVYLETNELV